MKAYESAFAIAINDHPLSLGSARQQSHDQVIVNAGADRRSGVTWRHFRPAGEAQELLASEGVDIVLPGDVRVVCSMFPAGILVMATVEVETSPEDIGERRP